MENQINVGDQNTQQIEKNQSTPPAKSKINYWMISTLILLVISSSFAVSSLLNQFIKTRNLPVETNDIDKKTSKKIFYFTKDYREQPLYQDALLASPEVLKDQKDKTWKLLECLYSFEAVDSYTISDIKNYITDKILLKGLHSVEKYKYKIIIKKEDGSIFKEYTSLQNISYTNICKDTKNYYVLFLTKGDKNNDQGLRLVKEVNAAGGWSGQPNFAVISLTGEMVIYENINSFIKNIVISDLSTGEFSSPTSKNFAYYGCPRLLGELGEDLYAICGSGEDVSGLFKINLSPLSFNEVSLCRWSILGDENVYACYDTQGGIYYRYK